jgi:hypothetical protein
MGMKFQNRSSLSVVGMTMRQNNPAAVQARRHRALLTGDSWWLGMSMTFGGVASRLPVFD